MSLPMIPLDTFKLGKRTREEDKNKSEGEYMWVFVGIGHKSGQVERIPYTFLVEDEVGFSQKVVNRLAQVRTIHKFKFRMDRLKKKLMVPNQYDGRVQEKTIETRGYVMHSKWMDVRQFELYAFTSKKFEELFPISGPYDMSCQQTFQNVYGVEWAWVERLDKK